MDRHFVDSLSVLPTGLLEGAKTLVDVGTGAGFPGLVLAMACPEKRFALLDAQQKRLSFLEAVCAATETRNVSLYHLRAEDGGRRKDLRESFDVAVVRAVAPLNVLCELLLPFVRPGGRMIAWKGPALSDEMAAGDRAARLLGGALNLPCAAPSTGGTGTIGCRRSVRCARPLLPIPAGPDFPKPAPWGRRPLKGSDPHAREKRGSRSPALRASVRARPVPGRGPASESLQMAYVGDTVWELMIRQRLAVRRLSVRHMHACCVRLVNAAAQAAFLRRIEPYLTESEQEVVRRGRNAHARHPAPRHQQIEDYHASTAFEALIGFLYLSGRPERIGALTQPILEEEEEAWLNPET